MILPNPEHRESACSLLPSSEILDVYQVLPRTPVGGDLNVLADYPGSLAEDLGADKRPGRTAGRWRFARGMDYHLLYKRFLRERGATHLMAPQIEAAEGKIAVATARQMGLRAMVPTDCRSLTGSYFAADAHAALPAHAAPRDDLLRKAAEFIERYRHSPTPAQPLSSRSRATTRSCTPRCRRWPAVSPVYFASSPSGPTCSCRINSARRC